MKYVIVVPSIAIKEGVLKSYEITKDYYKNQYNGVVNDIFMFDNSILYHVRSIASANTIDIIGYDHYRSFNKDANVMNRENDERYGAQGIDMIAEIRRIIINDGPQSVDNTD